MFEKRDTWKLVDIPDTKQVIGGKWMYQVKFNNLKFNLRYFYTCFKDGLHQNLRRIGGTNEVENLALWCLICLVELFVEEKLYIAQREGFAVHESECKMYKLQLVPFHPRLLLVVYVASKLTCLAPLPWKTLVTFLYRAQLLLVSYRIKF